MKAVFVLLFATLALAVAGDVSPIAVSDFKILRAELPKNREIKINWCNTCAGLMGQSINQLLNIIANGGVIGGCSKLCGALNGTKIEETVCNLACDYVGIKGFVKIIQDVDPDPVFICEEVKMCPVDDNGAASIDSLSPSPASGPVSTKFQLELVFTVQNHTGTTTIQVDVQPPSGQSFGASSLQAGINPGQYTVDFDVDTSQGSDSSDEGPSYPPGVYKVTAQVCAGTCGSKHPHAKVYDQKEAQFTITESDRDW
eukprot:CAMPEP_0177649966 /NCGR_PEP_ID=MMETSP0447-20121125/11678_1 /TAXON_ID=0 /ORGANISM="Stygamoeba regulata, Strain BSH-02190019" /LENGTH=255 /DNA_ID=CAMNT_0019152779 /DNA_START=61 /DNA_END=825 /DNA_ORIENTATION=-